MQHFALPTKQKLSLFFNLLIPGLEIIGIIVMLLSSHEWNLQYFTVLSNILALICCNIFVYYMLKKRDIPYWLKLLKYAVTVCLTLTLLVVIFILAPMYNLDYGYLLFHDELLYQHLLCPIFCLTTFLFFDNFGPLNRKISDSEKEIPKARISTNVLYSEDDFFAVILVPIYGIIIIILNLLNVLKGPYPFLEVREQSILTSLVWFTILVLSTCIIAVAIRKSRNKIQGDK